MTTHYKSSKGLVEISTMPLRYAENALDKLKRDEPEREAEILAISKHVEGLKAKADDAENPRVKLGSNNPPEETTTAPGRASWDAMRIHMDELLEQVEGITGVEITSQPMADQAAQLLSDIRQIVRDADKARKDEREPFDERVNEIQARYNAYIAPIKNKVPGLLSKAERALENQIAPWLRKIEQEKREREEAARREAEAKEAAAREAHQEALKSADIDEFANAEIKMAEAESAQKELKRVEREAANLKVDGGRAVHLRTKWIAKRIPGEGTLTINHYIKTQPQAVISFLQSLADDDVRRGVREIPGFEIIEERVL